MENFFWFKLIRDWRLEGKGQYGTTFPFLIGAIAEVQNVQPDFTLITSVFNEIISKPANGYYCEVRWCGNINEPVISVKPISDSLKVSIKAKFSTNDVISLGFTTDLMSMFHLDCETADECLKKLVDYTVLHVIAGEFSKNGGRFTSFTNDDIQFINKIASK